MTLELTGWLGAALFALCGLPQAWKTFRTGKADDISWAFLGMWGGGEVLTTVYVVGRTQWTQLPLLVNYALNTAVVVYLLYAKCQQLRRDATNAACPTTAE